MKHGMLLSEFILIVSTAFRACLRFKIQIRCREMERSLCNRLAIIPFLAVGNVKTKYDFELK